MTEQMAIYLCDPDLNTECHKTGCFQNGGDCRYTFRETARAGQKITKETRLAAWADIRTKLNQRERQIFDILRTGSKTAEEVADVLTDYIGYYDRNAAAPRLTEMERRGVVKVIGKRISSRTKKKIAVYAIA